MEGAFSQLEINIMGTPENEKSSSGLAAGGLGDLPADFVALILCHLAPREVAKAACVCRSFRAAAAFDSVWESIALTHLPSKYKELILALDDPQFASKRELFDYLCANRVFFANHTQGFWLERGTGGICLGISARAIFIQHSDDHRYWSWLPHHHNSSFFPDVAQLTEVCWFEAKGETECTLPAGTYTLSWRILLDKLRNWRSKPVTFSLSKNDDEAIIERKCFIDPRPHNSSPRRSEDQLGYFSPTIRAVENGWREYDVGEFSIQKGDNPNCVLKFSMMAVEAGQPWKSGLSLDGVVVRPSNTISKSQPESRESLIRFLEVKDRQNVYGHHFRNPVTRPGPR